MVSIIPLIEERQGAIERVNMGGQLEDYAEETVRLAESGSPGETAAILLRPHTGGLGWSLRHGGTWYTATHVENRSFRLSDALDLDDDLRIRHPEGVADSICMSDLRATTGADNIHRLPALSGTAVVARFASLQEDLQPTSISVESKGVSVPTSNQVPASYPLSEDAQTWINTSDPVRILILRGGGGQTVVPPDAPGVDGLGRVWTLPILQGEIEITISSHASQQIKLLGAGIDAEGRAVASSVPDGLGSVVNASHWQWRGAIDDGTLVVRSNSPSTLLLRWSPSSFGDSGDATLLDATGSALGTRFLPPAANGSLLIHNPQTTPTPVRIEGFYHSVPAKGDLRVTKSDEERGWVVAEAPIRINHLTDGSGSGVERLAGLDLLHADDSGRTGGTAWDFSAPTSPTGGDGSELHLLPLHPESGYDLYGETLFTSGQNGSLSASHGESGTITWDSGVTSRLVISGIDEMDEAAPIRAYVSTGDDGVTWVPSEGSDRCLPLGDRVTGWMKIPLPWDDVDHMSDGSIREAWRVGSHPFGISIELRGDDGSNPNGMLASGWAIPLPRLSYGFESSIVGMEIGARGGFIGTNHPEFQPAVLTPPPSREGPGPRLAATVPLTMPTADSMSGGGIRSVDLTLDRRDQLTSMQAWEVRRGWDGPYGEAIAAHAGLELDHSVDWLTYPGRLDLLDDYVGWVQLVPGSDESVYHAGGGTISFNLQLALLTHHAEAAA